MLNATSTSRNSSSRDRPTKGPILSEFVASFFFKVYGLYVCLNAFCNAVAVCLWALVPFYNISFTLGGVILSVTWVAQDANGGTSPSASEGELKRYPAYTSSSQSRRNCLLKKFSKSVCDSFRQVLWFVKWIRSLAFELRTIIFWTDSFSATNTHLNGKGPNSCSFVPCMAWPSLSTEDVDF